MAVSRGDNRGPEPPAPNTPNKSSPNPHQTPQPSSPEQPTEDPANPQATSPKQQQEEEQQQQQEQQQEQQEEEQEEEEEAREESEERLRELLKAYQETLDTVHDLPTVVWVPWGRKGVGRYFKVPYLRWFLRYFVEYHIRRSLDSLNRRFLATAALSSDPDSNSSKREAVKLYLQSLPSPPFRVLIFSAVLAALVIALPLQAFGNAFYVLDLVYAHAPHA